MVFDGDGQVASIDVGLAVRAVAQRVRVGGEHGPARSRIRTPDGRWLTLHGTNLPPAQQAVFVQPAGPADLWPVVAAAYGLTARERELVVLCARDCPMWRSPAGCQGRPPGGHGGFT